MARFGKLYKSSLVYRAARLWKDCADVRIILLSVLSLIVVEQVKG
jgi:hypothetical protein